nr:transcription-repair coupling factor [Desulfovibrionaceae bacterium]
AYMLYELSIHKQHVALIGSPEKLQSIIEYIRIMTPLYESYYAVFPAIEHYSKDIGLLQAHTLHALYMIAYRNPFLTFIPYTQSLSDFPSPHLFLDNSLEIYRTMELSYEHFLTILSSYGYTTTSMVHRVGEMAYRGDIVDIYPPDTYCVTKKGIVEALPLRVEFFGDTIEDIRVFNKESQRFIERIPSHTLYPIHFGCFTNEQQEEYRLQLPPQYSSVVHTIKEKNINIAPPHFYMQTEHTIFDWLPQDTLYLRIDDTPLGEALEKAEKEIEKYNLSVAERFSLDACMLEISHNAKEYILRKEMISVESISTKRESVILEEKTLHSFQELCPGKTAMEKPWKTLVEQFHIWKKEYKQIILVFKTHRNRDAFISLAQEEDILCMTEYSLDKQGIFCTIGDIEKASILTFAEVMIIPESLLYPNYHKKRGRKRSFKGLQQSAQLQEGMYVIHKDYGVGIYRGLHRIGVGGAENDYILLEYANEDKVYIPVYQIEVIQIYNSNEEHVALDSLGSSGWKNSISKARKSIEKIAHDLVAMYAQRSYAQKYRYGSYTELYREFEIAFAFEETPDQAQAIEDVLADMDSERPMDRLVCGDVGFGKTEVAIRACVRAALDGRQVAFLCPTTILAEQHYQTMQNRIAMLPLRVGLLNRFVPKSQQKKVIEGLANGSIDIVIGTHRILSKDIEIPNLSLLVLDEEHRFGVRHKEKLKLLRTSIDTLTLTATPIPRTLQLSMSGIRELSVIETPPLERKAVESILCEYGDSRITEALYRELERGGQVFWVYNRVHSIEERMRYIQKLCPQARIGIVHGQMNEETLEENMRAFWQGEIDILLATTIIESGLDFPLANTIIIESAHTFGLNQLYQLRGRVGRGERQGYAYFLIPEKHELTEIAMDRLHSILSLDYLGAGLQLAMEDLRIRGAGNILGEAQSGHIERIGIELYLEILEEEVAKLRSHNTHARVEKAHDVVLTLTIPSYIPEEYIVDSKERLSYYKRVS